MSLLGEAVASQNFIDNSCKFFLNKEWSFNSRFVNLNPKKDRGKPPVLNADVNDFLKFDRYFIEGL